MRLSPEEDAYGRELLAHLEGEPVDEIVERDDGLITVGGGTRAYFAPYRAWPSDERRAMRYVRGRVLDVGSGAGRVALYLQERGHEVVAIDRDFHARYRELNRRRGRMSGQLRIRIRYLDAATPWFDYLIVSPEEMERLVAGTGWHVRRLIEGASGMYAAVIEKA